MSSNEPPQTWNQFQKANKGKWSSAEMSSQWKLYKELHAAKGNNDIPADIQSKQAAASKPTQKRRNSNNSGASATDKDGKPSSMLGTLQSFWEKSAPSTANKQTVQAENKATANTGSTMVVAGAELSKDCQEKGRDSRVAVSGNIQPLQPQPPIQSFLSKPGANAAKEQGANNLATVEVAANNHVCQTLIKNSNGCTEDQDTGASNAKQVQLKQSNQQCTSTQQGSETTIAYLPTGTTNRQSANQYGAVSSSNTINYNHTDVSTRPSATQSCTQADTSDSVLSRQSNAICRQSVLTTTPTLESFFKKASAITLPSSIPAATVATTLTATNAATDQPSMPAVAERKLPAALLPPKSKPAQSIMDATSLQPVSKAAQQPATTEGAQQNTAVTTPYRMNVILLPPTNQLTWNQFQAKAKGMAWGKQRISNEWDLYKKTNIYPFKTEVVHVADEEIQNTTGSVSDQCQIAAKDVEGYGESTGALIKPSKTNPHSSSQPEIDLSSAVAKRPLTANESVQHPVEYPNCNGNGGTHLEAPHQTLPIHQDEGTSARNSGALAVYKEQVAVAAATAAHAAVAAAQHAEALAKVAETALHSQASQREDEGVETSHVMQLSSGRVSHGRPPQDAATTKKKGPLRKLVGKVRKALGMADGFHSGTQSHGGSSHVLQAPTVSDTASSRAFSNATAGALAAAVVVSTTSHPLPDAELADTASSHTNTSTRQHTGTNNANRLSNDRTTPVFPAPPLASNHHNSASHVTGQLEVSSKPPPHVPGRLPQPSGSTLHSMPIAPRDKNTAGSQAQKELVDAKIVDISATSASETAPDIVAEPTKPTSASGGLAQSASSLWDRMKKQGSLAISMHTSRKLARLQELHPIFLSLPAHTVPGVIRSPPRELIAHDDLRFFSGWQPWIVVNPDALRTARSAIPRLPGLYEWGVLLPGCALPSNPVAMYLGKAGRLINTNETLRTRFNKYIPGTGDWLGPKQEKDKFALWKEMQRRGFTLVYRWLPCAGVEPKAVETKLLELLDWAYNYQENVSRRLLMLPDGRLLADYPVIKFE